jgi:hypothetical protein
VRLLPGHDQWVIGPGTKDVHVTPASRRTPITRKANPVICGGVVGGTWVATGGDVTVTWFGDPRRVPRSALAEEVERLGGILGRALRLEVRRSAD